ncbi:MAG: hypothetical protein CMA64_09505 [Euryarchaeota archaeon]|jgi:hypothetical protein|nr:hypothetical protein [Euryarchaeota archaeon]
MAFEFIKEELGEARMFKDPKRINVSSQARLGDTLYSHLLGLQVMKYENPAQAKAYARSTMRFAGFDGVRAGATDLHNLLASVDKTPQAQVKRYLMDIVNGRKDTQADRRALIMIQRGLGVRSGTTNQMRRIIADWPRMLPNERKVAATRLGFALNHNARGSDLTPMYVKTVKKGGLGMDQAKSPLSKNPLVWGAVAGAALYKAIRDPRLKDRIGGIKN